MAGFPRERSSGTSATRWGLIHCRLLLRVSPSLTLPWPRAPSGQCPARTTPSALGFEGPRRAVCATRQPDIRPHRRVVRRPVPFVPDRGRRLPAGLPALHRAESGPSGAGQRAGRVSLVELSCHCARCDRSSGQAASSLSRLGRRRRGAPRIAGCSRTSLALTCSSACATAPTGAGAGP